MTAFRIGVVVLLSGAVVWMVYSSLVIPPYKSPALEKTVVPPYEFPALEKIASVRVNFAYDRDTMKFVEYDLPPECWAETFSTMVPAEYDPNPAKWQIMGVINILLKDGRGLFVWPYFIHDGPGALSAGTSPNGHRDYYRGGDSVKLQMALQAAYGHRRGISGQGRE
jgi:hypothetical protein